MKIDQIRTNLTTLRLYVEKMEAWANQANIMIHEMEEKLMDLEDEMHYQKYNMPIIMKTLKGAAIQRVSPPRQEIDRCSKNNIAVVDFYQYKEKNRINNKAQL